MYFCARWPDGEVVTYYSPSLVVDEYLRAGSSYPLPEFVERCQTALGIASERVRAKYGFACSRAAASLARIEAKARQCAGIADAAVLVEPLAQGEIA
jgi:uncharacterized repeat protein (TIGR04042 family)